MNEWISGNTNAAFLSPLHIWECIYTEAFVASALGYGESSVTEISSYKLPTAAICQSLLSTSRHRHIYSPKRLGGFFFSLMRRTVPKISITYITPLSESFKVQLEFRFTLRPLYSWSINPLDRRLGRSQPIWTYGEGKIEWELKLRFLCSSRQELSCVLGITG
jgi:hypothetical protein